MHVEENNQHDNVIESRTPGNMVIEVRRAQAWAEGSLYLHLYVDCRVFKSGVCRNNLHGLGVVVHT